MKLADLEILDAVANSKSLQEVAFRMHKTQPAISQSIKRLEQNLGFSIVDREAYRLKLTEQGRHFYLEATKLLAIRDDLKILANEFAMGNEAKFSICYEPISYQNIYNEAIGDIFKTYKSTEFSITSGPRFEALQQVNSGRAELGIGPWFDLFHATGELETMKVGEIELGIVAKKGLLPPSLHYEALESYPCIAMFESAFAFDSERLAYTLNTNRMKVDDLTSMKSFLLSGLGFALTSLVHCKNEIDQGDLERIRIVDRQDSFTANIHVFRKHTRQHGPIARAIWSRFKQLGEKYAG